MENTRKHNSLLRSASKSTSICKASADAIGLDYPEKKRRRISKRRTNLPEDLIMEILLKLPIKTLLRLKSACKIWYDLIRSPNFIAEHYKITASKKKVSIFYYGYVRTYSERLVFFKFLDVPVKFAVPICSEPLFVGCYNGLVCLCLSRSEFLLWNPATNQSRAIPMIRTVDSIRSPKYCSGLCFDSVANTHKIISIRFAFSKRDNLNMKVPEGKVYVILYVYTLKDDSWREEKLFAPCRLPNGDNMSVVTHLMKFMCWMVTSRKEKDKYILCLDMVDEEFKVIELPSKDHINRVTQLVDYKGSIAIFVSPNRHHRYFDLWVLNDCGGTNQSWSKQRTFRLQVPNVLRPLGFFSNGDTDFVILSTRCDGNLLWDPDSEKTENVILGKILASPVFLYSESLASVYR